MNFHELPTCCIVRYPAPLFASDAHTHAHTHTDTVYSFFFKICAVLARTNMHQPWKKSNICQCPPKEPHLSQTLGMVAKQIALACTHALIQLIQLTPVVPDALHNDVKKVAAPECSSAKSAMLRASGSWLSALIAARSAFRRKFMPHVSAFEGTCKT